MSVLVGDLVSLYSNEDGTGDIALQLLEEGFLLAEHRREKRLQKIISEYKAAMNTAKKNRVSLLYIENKLTDCGNTTPKRYRFFSDTEQKSVLSERNLM